MVSLGLLIVRDIQNGRTILESLNKHIQTRIKILMSHLDAESQNTENLIEEIEEVIREFDHEDEDFMSEDELKDIQESRLYCKYHISRLKNILKVIYGITQGDYHRLESRSLDDE